MTHTFTYYGDSIGGMGYCLYAEIDVMSNRQAINVSLSQMTFEMLYGDKYSFTVSRLSDCNYEIKAVMI